MTHIHFVLGMQGYSEEVSEENSPEVSDKHGRDIRDKRGINWWRGLTNERTSGAATVGSIQRKKDQHARARGLKPLVYVSDMTMCQ